MTSPARGHHQGDSCEFDLGPGLHNLGASPARGGPDSARWFTLTLNGQDVTVAEVPDLPERGLTSLTYDYRQSIQVRSFDDLDGRVLLHEVLHALLRTDPQQVCPADDARHEDFVRMLTAGLHDAASYRRSL